MRIRKYRAYHDEWGWVATSDILIFGDGAIRINHRDENGDIFNIYTEKTKELHVMDCLGLPDKKGNEIYEDDIFKITEEPTEINTVGYHQGIWFLDEHGLHLTDWRSCGEIIGNKYDNPELLRNENVK